MGLLSDPEHPVLGIDLGTTFSAIARWDGLGPEVYVGLEGTYTTQSVVYYQEDCEDGDEYVVGELAYQQTLIEPQNGIIGVKRLMDNRDYAIVLGETKPKSHNPVQISSEILRRLYKDVAEKFPGGKFKAKGLVVTVPYYFRANQRKNTREAAEAAGLPNVLGIVDEPVAASLSYAFDMLKNNGQKDHHEKILVFDLGGGTFDLTVFDYRQTADMLRFEVLGVGGDDRLGGMDFDRCIADYLISKEGIELKGFNDKEKRRCEEKLLKIARKGKEALAATKSYQLSQDGIPTRKGSFLSTRLTQDELQACILDYLAEVADIVLQTCMFCNVIPARRVVDRKEIKETIATRGIDGLRDYFADHKITRVVRVGGSSKMLFFRRLLEAMFGADKVYSSRNPDLAVVEGAAIYAAYLYDPEVLGRKVEIIHRNSHAFGVAVKGGHFSPLIGRNVPLPANAQKCYTPVVDNITELEIKVYQGESDLAKDNAHVGTVHVRGLPPRPARTLDIWITFDMNSEGLLMVTTEVKEKNQTLSLDVKPLETR
ncbi:MAG: Hsp70 family protein [Desulfomonile tiedjei]|uniref:Hsp70 family protein n=1 Tax=Desulfomonile tiedjei TaxID=2358 RepID=A0A9D6Z5L3_9BACT|nr:Hsp70 family protein [Desulfomonile tiedjei]